MPFSPCPPRLSIKSQAPSAAAGSPHATPAYAVLCTPNRSFQLRQVQTSNSLFVTQPALESHGNDIPIPSTCAIASCTATLELHPATASAVALLREVLPVYDIVAGDIDASSNGKDRLDIFADLPLSDGECQKGWDELMAFAFEGGSYQPSPNALSQVWRSINAAALADSIKLDSPFLTDDITKAVAEEGHPPGLVKSILAHLAMGDVDSTGDWSSLARTKTVAFVGKVLLASRHEPNFLIADFTDTWEDQLPESWRKDARLDAIEGAYEFPTQTTIVATGRATATLNGTVAAASAKPSARKWHEKFGKTRKK